MKPSPSYYADVVRERNRARAWNQYLVGTAVALFILLLAVCADRPKPPAATPCPAPGVMQLDPTTIRARAFESIEL